MNKEHELTLFLNPTRARFPFRKYFEIFILYMTTLCHFDFDFDLVILQFSVDYI